MTERPSGRNFLMVMLVWLAAATVLGLSGRMAALTPPLPQVLIGTLTFALIAAAVFSRGFREWLAVIPLRAVLAIHLTRYVGIAFLVLYARGQMPREFAVSAGWGDIVAATMALALLLLPGPLEKRASLLFLWNAFGLADILGVVITATRLALADPASMHALLVFPMTYVPTVIVPFVIASHVLVFWRLRQLRR